MKKLKNLFISVLFFALLFSSCATTEEKTNPTGLKAQLRTDIITVTGGAVRGIYNKEGSVEIYAGIPFAAPPLGELRWKGVLEADHFTPMAMQKENGRFFNFLMNLYTHSKNDRTYKGPMSEDCLYLNVWKPAKKAPQGGWPVLVYVHG